MYTLYDIILENAQQIYNTHIWQLYENIKSNIEKPRYFKV